MWDFKTGELVHTLVKMGFTPYAIERQESMNMLGLLRHPSAVIYCLVLGEFRIGRFVFDTVQCHKVLSQADLEYTSVLSDARLKGEVRVLNAYELH
jgi:hypothetical protein